MTVLVCQEELLIAKREMLQWNKTNKKTQIDITVKQISTIQSQLDVKKTDFQEVITRELQEINNISIFDEVCSVICSFAEDFICYKYLFCLFFFFKTSTATYRKI